MRAKQGNGGLVLGLGLMCGFGACGFLLYWVMAPSPPLAPDRTQVDRPESATVRGSAGPEGHGTRAPGPRSTPASPQLLDDGQLDAERPTRLDEGSDERWLDTRVDLLDPTAAFDQQEGCRERLGGFDRWCEYVMTFELERGDVSGKIVAATAEPEAGAPEGCEAFARCMAEARIGTAARLPAGLDDPTASVAIEGRYRVPVEIFSKPQIQGLIESLETSLEQRRGSAGGSAQAARRIELQTQQLELWRLRLARMP